MEPCIESQHPQIHILHCIVIGILLTDAGFFPLHRTVRIATTANATRPTIVTASTTTVKKSLAFGFQDVPKYAVAMVYGLFFVKHAA